MVIGLSLSKHFINFIVEPMQKALRANHLDDKLYYTSPAGYISLVINLGLYLGIVFAMPFVLYQIWLFVAPGLYKHERAPPAGFIVSSMVLFLCGIAFGYFILMLPQMLNFLISFAYDGPVKPLISINEYFSLILIVLVGLGIIFELPVLIFILSLFGIVTPKFLLKNFRYAMLIITVAAAIITPTPDATTMLVFMAPMIVLYFVGVFVSYVVIRRKRSGPGRGWRLHKVPAAAKSSWMGAAWLLCAHDCRLRRSRARASPHRALAQRSGCSSARAFRPAPPAVKPAASMAQGIRARRQARQLRPASAGVRRHPPVQDYIRTSCGVSVCRRPRRFPRQTPIGELAMENIVAKVPGTGRESFCC